MLFIPLPPRRCRNSGVVSQFEIHTHIHEKILICSCFFFLFSLLSSERIFVRDDLCERVRICESGGVLLLFFLFFCYCLFCALVPSPNLSIYVNVSFIHTFLCLGQSRMIAKKRLVSSDFFRVRARVCCVQVEQRFLCI